MSAAIERLKRGIPWYLKIAAKMALSRLPLSYAFWQRLALFRHGEMDDPEVAIAMLQRVMKAAGLGPRLEGLSVLEIGPGDALSTAVVAQAFGARAVTLIDAGVFARQDIEPYIALIGALSEKGYDVRRLAGVSSVPELLERCHARYLTAGLESVASLEPNSVDFVFSNAVLEHIRLDDFAPMCRALWRAMRSDAVAFHTVDLRDHLAYGLNNLRFSAETWEAPLFARSGFYTNRIRYSEMIRLFGEAGFHVEVLRKAAFDQVPIERRHLAPPFRGLSNEELRIADFDMLLRKRQS